MHEATNKKAKKPNADLLDDQPIVVEDLNYEHSLENFSPLKTKVDISDSNYNLNTFNVTNMAQSPLGFTRKAGTKITDKKMSQGTQSSKYTF